jgi:hypothetical protein
LGVARGSVKAKYNKMRREGRLKQHECAGHKSCSDSVIRENKRNNTMKNPKYKPHSWDELRRRHDNSKIIPEKIQEVCNKFLVDGGWFYDYEMRELCGCPTNRWRRYADTPSFVDKYQVKIDGKIVWVDPNKKIEVERMKVM